MFQKVLKVSLLSLVVSLLPSSFQAANATDILWNPGVGNDLGGTSPGLVPGAGIKNTGLLVNKSNPDELIMKIIMNDSFEDKPFSNKGRNIAMWVYWPNNYCWNTDKANCEGLFIVSVPFNPSSYPLTKSSEYVFVQKHDKAANVNIQQTTCKAPWWIESTNRYRDTWSFAVSITCLGIPKEFGWYGYSSINIGQKDLVTDFTQVQTITYPFHDLAASAAAKNSQITQALPPANENSKQVCAIGTGINGFRDEQCTESGNWAFQVCDAKPKADLQILRNKKWVKIKTVNGVKNLEDCPDDKEISGYYFYRFTGGLISDYRIKNYGSKKYSTGYINLKITRKDSN